MESNEIEMGDLVISIESYPSGRYTPPVIIKDNVFRVTKVRNTMVNLYKVNIAIPTHLLKKVTWIDRIKYAKCFRKQNAAIQKRR